MKLTGQCLRDFNHYLFYIHYDEHPDSFTRWNNLLESEKYGVIVDFADSVGIHIEIMAYFEPKMNGPKLKNYGSFVNMVKSQPRTYVNRHEARTAAVEKFDELYNQRTKPDRFREC